jgi:NAD(P)-dependent dehydrogenase (short-subunit alcohol dehydrogenase family)
MSKDLARQTALVTGATAGIGRATALALAARGADVIVHGRNKERAADTLQQIEALGARARFEPADLADPTQVTALAERAGHVDILVNNAGIFHFARTADTGPRHLRRSHRHQPARPLPPRPGPRLRHGRTRPCASGALSRDTWPGKGWTG